MVARFVRIRLGKFASLGLEGLTYLYGRCAGAHQSARLCDFIIVGPLRRKFVVRALARPEIKFSRPLRTLPLDQLQFFNGLHFHLQKVGKSFDGGVVLKRCFGEGSGPDRFCCEAHRFVAALKLFLVHEGF